MAYTEVGRLNKSFGIKGFIKVIPKSNYNIDLEKTDVWFVQKGADMVPYFVEKIENEPHFLVKFEDIDSPEAARQITGCTLSLRTKDITTSASIDGNQLNELSGFQVISNGDTIGNILRVEEFPQQLMAIIQTEIDEVLMPLTPEFILDIDVINKKLEVELPEGFLESQR